MKKKFWSLGALFFTGVVTGIFCYNIMFYNTINHFLRVIKTDILLEQRGLAIEALNTEDTVRSVIHQYNVVKLSSDEEFEVLRGNNGEFTFFFPFELTINKVVLWIKDFDTTKAEKKIEGIKRGKLAYMYDIAGLETSAENEWEKAMLLYGSDNLQKFQKHILKIIKIEREN